MDFLLELVLGLFFEMPLEMAMESRSLKSWVKTVLAFITGNLVTVLMTFIALSSRHDPASQGEWKIAAGFGAVWFVLVAIVCICGHRRGWRRERTCPLEKAEAAAHVPNPAVVIRTARLTDLDAIARVEAECFPAAEAATRGEFEDRLRHYANHFWLMFDGDRLISFADGFVTDTPDLTDEMYADATLHNEAGAWQMVFGVNTVPDCRRRGYAAQLIKRVIQDARDQGRRGVVLTCKPEKVVYYLKFGFVNEGISRYSTHGGAVWHQMRLTF